MKHASVFAKFILVPFLIFCCPAEGAETAFPRQQPVHVVCNPASPLEQRLVDQLGLYLTKVTGRPIRRVAALWRVPAGQPAILLFDESRSLPLDMQVSGDSPEAFALKTGMIRGHAVVVAAGNGALGLKQAVHRLVIKSR